MLRRLLRALNHACACAPSRARRLLACGGLAGASLAGRPADLRHPGSPV